MKFFTSVICLCLVSIVNANSNAVSDFLSAQNIRNIVLTRRSKEMIRQMEKIKADSILDDSSGGKAISTEEVEDVTEMMKSINKIQLEIKAVNQNMKKVMSGEEEPPISRSQRIAALNLLAFPDEIRSARNGFGQLKGDVLSIFSNGRILKKLFYVAAIELPIENLPGTQRCFTFKYGAMRQSLCGADVKSRNAWMNAISETWYCLNYRICGKMSDADAASAVKDKESKDKEEKDGKEKDDKEDKDESESEEPEGDVDVYKLEVVGNKGVLTLQGRVVDAARLEED